MKRTAWILAFAALAANVVLLLGPRVVSELLEPPSAEAATAAETQEQPQEAHVDTSGPLDAPVGVEHEAATEPDTRAEAPDEAPVVRIEVADTSTPSPMEQEDGIAAAEPEAVDAAIAAEAERVFQKIVRAYESMEPEHAAAALLRLSRRDIYSTVRVLLSTNPRRCGAILDAMSATAPDAAAAITAEMIAQASLAALTPAR